MLISLLVSAFLMGLVGVPHCAAMCATPCAAALPSGLPVTAVLGRSMGYALLGALAAGATATLASWSRWATALQPFWVMLLAATTLLGAWMLFKGAMPLALQNHGLNAYRRLQRSLGDRALLKRHPWLMAWLPSLLGMAWAALPCGLLYGAVMVAALAPSVWQGALVMGAFSLPGALALWWLPRQMNVWRWAARPLSSSPVALQSQALVPVLWIQRDGQPAPIRDPAGTLAPIDTSPPWWAVLVNPQWAIRSAGALLAVSAAWALSHRLMDQWRAWCA